MATLEEIEERCNFVLTTNLDAMPQRIEAAEVILREDILWLIAEVKRLRIENAKIKAEHRLMKISIAQKNAACSEIHFGDDTNQ